jgi:hypothetical protein
MNDDVFLGSPARSNVAQMMANTYPRRQSRLFNGAASPSICIVRSKRFVIANNLLLTLVLLPGEGEMEDYTRNDRFIRGNKGVTGATLSVNVYDL